MKTFLLLLLLFYGVVINADVKYNPFIDAQIEIVQKMNENNVTKEQIEELLHEQAKMYESTLNAIMAEKKNYIDNANLFESEIFALKKIIAINKRAGNKYAVIRDEVQIKAYLVIRAQRMLLRDVLKALDERTIDDFDLKLNQYVVLNRANVEKIYEQSYDDILKINSDSTTLRDAKSNIEEFLLLKDVSSDIISYLYKFENKMYRLNKYYKFHLISFAIFINSSDMVEMINPLLENYNLSVIKLLFIILLGIFAYLLRKIVYLVFERLFVNIDYIKRYSQQILEVLKKPIEVFIYIITLNMILYVYNDFSNDEEMSRFFNILYGFFFTYIVYKIVNTVATIKLCDVTSSDAKMKNDIINVGIKIVNFIIILIGFLIMLYLAGVNLTAVLSGLGIGGFAVAFAAKDTISNFFGTLSVLLSDVFAQGDWIAINNEEGVVVEIGLRVTTIRTFDNALIAIPNGTFASADIKNWSRRTLGRRIKMTVGVKYDSPRENLQKALRAIREMLENHPDIATKETVYEHKNDKLSKLVSKDDLEGVKKTLLVNLDEFAGSSINIMVYCFSKSVEWSAWLDTKEDVMFKIMGILEDNSLEFAFPSLSIYNEN